MSAVAIPISWITLRIRYALHVGKVDLALLSEECGFEDQHEFCTLVGLEAADMGIAWICPHSVTLN
jgi:hypothetical protein